MMGTMDVLLTPWLTSLHLGALHPVEGLLVVLLAFGPFVLLGVVIGVRRRQDARDEAAVGTDGRHHGGQREAQRER
jgi:Na+-translocating ferredoxin:NAD+ oxidoreductase RnfE subunit